VSNVLIGLLQFDETVEPDAFRRARVGADERSYDTRPSFEHTATATLCRTVIRPPAGWQAS
jgi:hypothetical protein